MWGTRHPLARTAARFAGAWVIVGVVATMVKIALPRALPPIASSDSQQCDGFTIRDCLEVAGRLESGVGARKNSALALVVYRHICNLGLQDACDAFHRLKSDRDLSRESSAEIEEQRRQCDRRSPVGCYLYGFMLQHGFGTTADPPRAADVFEAACQDGELRSCYRLAAIYDGSNPEEYYGRPRDYAKARSLYERSCSRAQIGCGNLGNLLADGRGGPKDAHRAIRLIEKECARDWAIGCANLGIRLLNGMEVDQDLVRAEAILGQGCKLGSRTACRALGFAERDGKLRPADYANARGHLKRGCEIGDLESCYNLGHMLLSYFDQNNPAILDEAEGALAFACKYEFWQACGMLGESRIKGPFATDWQSGFELLERACLHGEMVSCELRENFERQKRAGYL